MKPSKIPDFHRIASVINRDPRGRIVWAIDGSLGTLSTVVDSVICRAVATAWGIQVGRYCRFYGLTQFSRCPESIIQVGKHCCFRSAFRSNMVGMSHPCSIATREKGAVLKIGEGCGFSSTSIVAVKSVLLGKFVLCGANVVITDTDFHAIDPLDRHNGASPRTLPVAIEDNVWLGMNCTVLKGVTIGKNTVIGANSVVTLIHSGQCCCRWCPCQGHSFTLI